MYRTFPARNLEPEAPMPACPPAQSPPLGLGEQ